MADDITVNHIERLARAILAQLAPLTGARATGVVSVTANSVPGDHRLPANSYLLPVVGGQLRHDLAFKVQPNPATTDGAWECDTSETTNVPVTSNVGGKRHNVPADAQFRFDPPVAGFQPTATLEGAMTGGSNTGALAKSVAFFEDLDVSDPSQDLFAAMVELPGLLLIWTGSEPAEGTTAGLRQGSTRQQRGARIIRESFQLYVVSGRLGSDSNRRQEGLVLMQAATRLLTDHMQNRDGEQLSTAGAGLEVNERRRVDRGQQAYLYMIGLRTNQTLLSFDERTFNVWERTRFELALPAREDPEPTAPFGVVDATEPMP
jgi:hypothetical protein